MLYCNSLIIFLHKQYIKCKFYLTVEYSSTGQHTGAHAHLSEIATEASHTGDLLPHNDDWGIYWVSANEKEDEKKWGRKSTCARQYVNNCCCSVAKSCPNLRRHALEAARLLCPWELPGRYTVDNYCRGIFRAPFYSPIKGNSSMKRLIDLQHTTPSPPWEEQGI